MLLKLYALVLISWHYNATEGGDPHGIIAFKGKM